MTSRPLRVIGLTGLPSSGKGEVAAAILSAAATHGWRCAHLSFSDEIKAEALRRGHDAGTLDRELLSRVATDLRRTGGSGILAERIVDRISSWPEPVPEVFVVEALRHIGEAAVLRRRFGERFSLVAVVADLPVIAGRLLRRARPDESPAALRSVQDAIRLLETELRGSSPEAPNVGQTIAIADVRIENNGTLEDLRSRVTALFEQLWATPTPRCATTSCPP